MAQGRLYGCPVELALQLLGGKWKTVILCRLKEDGPMRYGALRRAVPDLSDKVLTRRLQDLEQDGFIVREADGGYGLTEKARSLAPALQALYDWGLGAAPAEGARFRPRPDGGAYLG